jgi:uncharacterized protein (TIGR02466 family)
MSTPQLQIPAKITLQEFFATPVAFTQLLDAAEVNVALKSLIIERSKSIPSTDHSNRGGWQSTWDFHEWGGSHGSAILSAARQIATRLTCDRTGNTVSPNWTTNSWANVNRRDNGNEFHIHPGSLWSGTYYVDGGGGGGGTTLGGEFEIQDPRGPAAIMYAPELAPKVPGGLTTGVSAVIRPEAGMMVIFPGWLSHSVRPYNGDGVRISIAFNFSL